MAFRSSEFRADGDSAAMASKRDPAGRHSRIGSLSLESSVIATVIASNTPLEERESLFFRDVVRSCVLAQRNCLRDICRSRGYLLEFGPGAPGPGNCPTSRPGAVSVTGAWGLGHRTRIAYGWGMMFLQIDFASLSKKKVSNNNFCFIFCFYTSKFRLYRVVLAFLQL